MVANDPHGGRRHSREGGDGFPRQDLRAEPIVILYARAEVDHVHHFGDNPRDEFGDLEDQLINMTTAGYMGERSPDRADAAVWALTELSTGSSFEIIGIF